ncbi:phytanoyl-CoA dioxygenase PhyH [Leptospira wolbachii serovar Codice str. CDC]|uniref:Phytanoyl-CoA dioxygenase PhyH n=1 Tax=Leptospira wolbachii serovar Codice str. CDC TaxID=1218599 RepID=R9A2A8_9LEPT|nr:phytanoyl-CoA dioxygenase family protein [Leptospira wolbachii]EOQ96247.1 phytanoyl-CoA dioxygenase PhyH [Leptospira wolbachii serovar Codice str. CDC]
MNGIDSETKSKLKTLGYHLFPNLIPLDRIRLLKEILIRTNEEWLQEFQNPKNINSAYLTSAKYMKDKNDRKTLFEFIESDLLLDVCDLIFNDPIYFLNTQIFFNPLDPNKLPYWHRDIQYLGISEEEQKNRIEKDHVWHFRIPLEEDPGIWLIPGSHTRWDTEKERQVRLELEGKKNNADMEGQILIPHNPGDLLVFSAHLIHKGNYGSNRFSFDILYTNFPEQKQIAEKWNHFPEENYQRKNPKRKTLFQLV